MKKALVLLGLLIVSQYGHAQHVVSVYDGEGKEVGTPLIADPRRDNIVVIRPDGLGILLYLSRGAISDVASSPSYAEPDCAGQLYLLEDTAIPVITDWLSQDSGGVALILRDSYKQIVVKSRYSGDECVNVEENRYGYPATFVNPIDYGLVELPNGNWGYPGPLEIRATKVTPSGEAIFCNGFENCPQQ